MGTGTFYPEKKTKFFSGLKVPVPRVPPITTNVPFWPISLILKTAAATLTQLHAREEKTHVFLAFLLKIIQYFIVLNTSLSYIRMVMGEKVC